MVGGSDWWKTKQGSERVVAVGLDLGPDLDHGQDQAGPDRKTRGLVHDLVPNHLKPGNGKASQDPNPDHPGKFLVPDRVIALDQKATIAHVLANNRGLDPGPGLNPPREMTNHVLDHPRMEWKKIRHFSCSQLQDFHFLLRTYV